MLVDPKKLLSNRLVLDDAIAEIVLEQNVWRLQARRILARTLEYELESETIAFPRGRDCRWWWYATAVSEEESWSDGEDVVLKAEIRQRFHCQAAAREDAEMAVLCRLLDDRADLAMSKATQVRKFGCRCAENALDVWICVAEMRLRENEALRG